MIKLLQIEYKKLFPYTTFWVIFGLFFAFTPIVFYGAGQIKIDGFPIDFATMYNFPDVWNNVTYIGSWFNLLIGMLLVILVCNEFSFKTFRQHVIDGNSKADFIVSKILLMTSFALISTLYLFVLGAIFGFSSGGGEFLTDIKYLLIYFIQTLGYMSVGLIVAVLIRSSALSIIAFICSILAESIVRALIPDAIDQYFPMKIISNLTPFPTPKGFMVEDMRNAVIADTMSLNTTLIVAVIYIFAFWGISYFILTKKDIK
ncbi:MAG: ABC transporter permease [Vicingaceae bacterium]|nr:ABC transporter permease [Vicingaceae bacterium]